MRRVSNKLLFRNERLRQTEAEDLDVTVELRNARATDGSYRTGANWLDDIVVG